MALDIITSIHINATPEQVWAKFSAFETYADWNPFLTKVSGNIQEGNNISIVAGGMSFQPKVLVYKVNKEFKWIGKLLFSGIFDGTHHFILEENSDGSTTFHHNEYFKGILVPIFKKQLLKDTKAGFEAMNQKLKEMVEEG